MGVSAIILAGGRATRMGGIDKGLVLINQQPMVAHVIDRLKPQVDEIFINANREIAQYSKFSYPVLQDTVHDFAGPLAGFQLGLTHAQHPYLLTAPCDSPFLPQDLSQRLLKALLAHDADIAVATTHGKNHPVLSMCKTITLPHLNQYLAQGGRKVNAWQKNLRYIEVDFSDCADAFANINTFNDLEQYKK